MSNNKIIRVYGIPNCDTVKKARAWLTQQGLEQEFHDFKKQGASAEKLQIWIQALGWEKVINRQGTTWRKLDAAQQASVTDSASAINLLLENASAIKRPIVEWPDGRITAGFKAEEWSSFNT